MDDKWTLIGNVLVYRNLPNHETQKFSPFGIDDDQVYGHFGMRKSFLQKLQEFASISHQNDGRKTP